MDCIQLEKQRFFNGVVEHLRKQGRRALRDDHPEMGCAYRTESGLKCAIGSQITAEAYNRYHDGNHEFDNDLEGKAVDKPEVLDALTLSGWNVEALNFGESRCSRLNEPFLQSLQQCLHDHITSTAGQFPVDFERAVRLFAADWNLDIPPKQ